MVTRAELKARRISVRSFTPEEAFRDPTGAEARAVLRRRFLKRKSRNRTSARVLETRGTLQNQIVMVAENLRREIEAIEGRSRVGMIKAAKIVSRRSSELVPVDTSNLQKSVFISASESSRGPTVTIGYRAAYAAFVHENLDVEHDKPTQAKFLETALNEKAREVLEAIRKEAEIR